MSEPELEDPRLAKRRRPFERQAESLILDHVPTPKQTPLPTPSGPDFRSGASNEPSPGPLDSDSQRGGPGSPVPSQNNLEKENDDDGTHDRGIVEEPFHSPRQSISPLEEIEGDQYIDLDSDRRAEKSSTSDGEIGKSHEDELSQADDASYKASVTISRRRKPSNRPVSKKGRNPSQISLRPRDPSSMPTTTSRQVSSSQSRHLSTSRTERVTWSRSPQKSYPGTKAGDEPNINDGPSENMAYQIADLSLYPVPQGSSVVTAIIRYSESKLPSNLMASYPSILGERGQVMRMTQVSLDSWLLLGYRYGDVACTRGSSTLRHADRMSSFRSDAASHDSDYPEDDGDEDDENGDEGTGEYRPHAVSSGQRLGRGDIRFRKRTRVPWLESDDLRLLAYKKDMDMEWKDIFEHFPDRTPGAVRTRWHMLRRNDPRTPKDDMSTEPAV
ncbi:hypothetical protein BU23DRAFT_563574 [Bimuria novae-zelandiae CBS 107.79]|uniref:Myb-like domain-containing protein n=1 Tax=Bimuria novae-zelandiae CBS 107.79 TaxID=1447943 RepID=A0A6A5VWX5_9PLEO|nr:hypothetical protein BU23DRAFT_563574 [Bimuria novae-zelandiae CBS 107.79]